MDGYTIAALGLAIGYIADLVLGDPAWLPHPVVLFGKAISRLENIFRKGGYLIIKGAVAVLLLVGGTFSLFYLAGMAIEKLPVAVQVLYTTLFVFFGLANRTLITEVRNVFIAVEKDVESGRKAVSRIVGRDTARLNPQQIRKAALETLSENLSDGVVAPLFYYALLGVPGIMAYKMVNTLDSMWGYKSERFILFGRVAARLDDVANYIPARITALLMALAAMNGRSLSYIFRFGSKHTSPNSGYPEAALAGILTCQFGGGNSYGGTYCSKPLIGATDRNLVFTDMEKAVFVNHKVTFMLVAAVSLLMIAAG